MVCLKLRCKYSVYFLNYQRKKQKNAEILNITLHVYAEILNSKTYKYAEILSIFVKAFPALETLIFSKRAFWGHPGGTLGAHFLALSAPVNIHIISVLGQKGAQGAHFFSVSTRNV